MRTECVLSLDWDWFVGKENGATCKCCLDCPEGRKSERTRKIQPCKRARCRTGEEWQRREKFIQQIVDLVSCFHVKRFVVANSHGHIMRFLPPHAEVHNVDLHRDSWGKEIGECGHWANRAISKSIKSYHWYKSENGVEKLLPKWLARRRTLDLVFLALSTPHTARADDRNFFDFARALAGGATPEFVGVLKRQLKQGYARSKKCA